MLGFTKTRASCQLDQARDSHAQSNRSAGFSRGRRPLPWSTASWWRKERISSCSEARERSRVTMEVANQLSGVTMHEPGVSRLVSVDVEEAAALAAI